VKRCADVAVVLVLALPAALVLAVVLPVALVLQGWPLFFVQERVGRHGVPFRLLKLRTMSGGPSADGRAYREHTRVTGLGRALRRLRLDELPQLVNVLSGAMSLVGPRPLLPGHVAAAGGGGRRHDVRPGLTCYAQLELARTGWLDRYDQVRLDELYLDRMSPRTDAAILLATVLRRGAPGRLRPDAGGVGRATHAGSRGA
jgi:lipopolysaccharide/colanic/teichoic acid biosynthesis glycosyltransferase